jgi:hypothetical protein
VKRLVTRIATTAAVLASLASTAGAVTDVSSNWSGYSVSGATFSSVSGGWTQPKATCTTGSTSSAFWVGLGGNSASNTLEQIGTSTDCDAYGSASYSAWYELVPAASVPIKLKVSAGNKLWASVAVRGTKVTVRIKNLTRKTSFAKTLTMSAPDVTSAEWIAEAPSACDSYGRCRTVALTNFGKVAFTKALTTSGGHTGTVSDPMWAASSIALQSSAGFGGPFAAMATAAQAVPTDLSTDGSAFSVAYGELSQAQQPDPYGGAPFYGSY